MRSAVFALLALLLFVLAGCAADASQEDVGEAQPQAIAFSPNRLTLTSGTAASPPPGDAYWMSKLAGLAYLDSASLVAALAAIGAKGEVAYFANSTTGTEGFFLGTSTHAVLVFRGTEPSLTDLATDVTRFQVPTVFGRVHQGFYDAFRSIWDDGHPALVVGGAAAPGEGMRSFLFKRSSVWGTNRPLFITGHSLGAALATLAAVHTQYAGCVRLTGTRIDASQQPVTGLQAALTCRGDNYRPVSALYTFGSPRIGDETFGALAGTIGVAPLRNFRYTNARDVVPSLPYFGYWHPTERGDEHAAEIHLDGPATGHGIANYIANLESRIPKDLQVPGFADSDLTKRAHRVANALLDERPPLQVNATPRSPAQHYIDGFRQRGITPDVMSTTIDGQVLDLVVASSVESGARLQRFIVCDARGFVVEVGWFDGVQYVNDLEPRP